MTKCLVFYRAAGAKVIYVPCFKNASTSVLLWLAELEASIHGVVFASSLRLRRHAKNHLIIDRVDLSELPRYLNKYADHFLFGISRNPYSRIASAYSDKVNRLVKKVMPKLYVKAVCAQVLGGPANWSNNKSAIVYMKKNLPFSGFLEALQAVGVDIDPHYQPQCVLMRPDLLVGAHFFDQVDFADPLFRAVSRHVGELRLETTFVATKVIPSVIPSIPRRNMSPQNDQISYDLLYTPGLRKIAKNLYHQDFIAFGYE